MKKFMEKVYYKCGEILKKGEYIDVIPDLKLTNAKSYYGKIRRDFFINEYGEKEVVYEFIALSRFNLYVDPSFYEEEDYYELIETICHEFAHMHSFRHDKRHFNITKMFVNEIKKVMPCYHSALSILS